MPKNSPTTVANIIAPIDSIIVLGKYHRRSAITGRLLRVERPRSPCSSPSINFRNWICKGLSRYNSCLILSISSLVAVSPAITNAGSPGSKRTIRNTIMITPKIVGTLASNLLTIYLIKTLPYLHKKRGFMWISMQI